MNDVFLLLGAAMVAGFGFEMGRAGCRWLLDIRPSLLVSIHPSGDAPVSITGPSRVERGEA